MLSTMRVTFSLRDRPAGKSNPSNIARLSAKKIKTHVVCCKLSTSMQLWLGKATTVITTEVEPVH
jgi:hypothetical protein